MTLADFIDKWNGETADWDHHYGGQCVDLFRYYCDQVLGISQPNSVGGAVNFWGNYDADSKLKDNFDKVVNTPAGVPQYGDVIVWSGSVAGGLGHISIFLSGDVNSFVSLDQNWPVGSKGAWIAT
jgi:hypothetical protein